MEKRSYSDPDLTSVNQTRKNLKSARLNKINQSLRLKGEINFQLNDTFTFDPQKYIENAKLEVIDNEADNEKPPPYTSLSDGNKIKKFKSETDLKSIEISVVSFEKLKIQHKKKKKRPSLQAKQGYGSIVERLIGGIFSISCLFPKKINFSNHHQQNIAHEDLDLQDFLGRGAQGSVYRAIYKNDEVAVKIVESKEDADVQHLMKLDHKNLVKFKGTAINGEKKFFGIIMEFCPNKSLYEFLNHQILLEPSRIIDMAKQITDGMSYLHEKKIVHRDLKSPNILLAENNVLKITDFGACKDISDEKTEKSFKGTVYWMAPELIRNENYSEKVDIYSFGVVFWELLTCEKPYNNLDPKSVMFGVGKNKIRLQIPNFVPDGIKILLIQCFGKAKNRPNFKTISKHLDIFCQNEDIIQLDKEFEENKTAWKEDIGRTCRNFLNNVDPYELQNQIETKSKELDCLKKKESRIMAEIDKRTEVCNKFFFRLQAISLELDQREENIICREKKLNIQPEKRMIKPLLKQLFKNESNKIRTFNFPKKSKNLWLNKCLDAQSLIIKNSDIFYYMNKCRRFKLTRNYGLNLYDCVHIKLILKFNLDSKIFFNILNEKNLRENSRLHFLNFKSRELKKLSKKMPCYLKDKFKERINLFFIFQRHKVFNDLYELRQRPSLFDL